jgi:hypothetical protein
MLIFTEGEKPEKPEKNPRSKGENQQQTQLTYDTDSGNRTRITVVRGERSHRYATHASVGQFLIALLGHVFTSSG